MANDTLTIAEFAQQNGITIFSTERVESNPNMNGTSRGELQAQTNTAIYALKKAIRSFQEAAPNGRDYYPQDKGQILGQTMIKAQDEHYDRLTRLQSVLAELEQIQEHLYNE